MLGQIVKHRKRRKEDRKAKAKAKAKANARLWAARERGNVEAVAETTPGHSHWLSFVSTKWRNSVMIRSWWRTC